MKRRTFLGGALAWSAALPLVSRQVFADVPAVASASAGTMVPATSSMPCERPAIRAIGVGRIGRDVVGRIQKDAGRVTTLVLPAGHGDRAFPGIDCLAMPIEPDPCAAPAVGRCGHSDECFNPAGEPRWIASALDGAKVAVMVVAFDGISRWHQAGQVMMAARSRGLLSVAVVFAPDRFTARLIHKGPMDRFAATLPVASTMLVIPSIPADYDEPETALPESPWKADVAARNALRCLFGAMSAASPARVDLGDVREHVRGLVTTGYGVAGGPDRVGRACDLALRSPPIAALAGKSERIVVHVAYGERSLLGAELANGLHPVRRQFPQARSICTVTEEAGLGACVRATLIAAVPD